MKVWTYFIFFILGWAIFYSSFFAQANELTTDTEISNQGEISSIKDELEAISVELSKLQNIFIYNNKEFFSESESLDIFLKLNQLENRLSSAVGFLEQIDNNLEKVTKILILKISEITEEVSQLGGQDISSAEIIKLYDDISETNSDESKTLNDLPEDQKEYLSIKAIFDDENYLLAIEEFTSFISRFDSSKLALRAKFWKAESNLRLNRWRPAAEGFLDTFSSDPNGPLSSYALFGLVLSLSELGENQQSCVTLSEIESRDKEKFRKFEKQLQTFGKDLNCSAYE